MPPKAILSLFILVACISFISASNLQSTKTAIPIEPYSESSVLEPNQTVLYPAVPGRAIDTLIYDDGTPSSGYYWGAGTRMANRMSPAQACQILAIQYYCWTQGGSETIDATIYDWTGSAPGGQLGTQVSLPLNSTQTWREADFSGQGLNVTGDFIASFNMNNDQTVLGFDFENNGRSWDFNGSSWSAWTETYFIRAIVEYPDSGDPDIDCTPNPLVFNAKDYVGQLEFTYRLYPQKIDPELEEKMGNSSQSELLPVIVEFDKTIDTQFLYNLVKDLPKSSRRNITINTLQDFTEEYQEDVMDYLESMETEGKVERLSQLWLTNSIGMNVTKDVIEQIANHPRIALIWLDDKLTQPHGRKTEDGYDEAIKDGREIVWNVLRVNADDVWALGYTGDGIIVGHIDTGCNYNHVDLNSHMWDGGGSYPNHGWDYINNDNDPMDTHGHGTHTAGTVSSDGTAGSNCGVAPDALMMILRGVPGSLSVLQNCVNFCLTQGADVITMSAGWDSAGAGGSWNSLSTQNRNMLDNCMTSGVVFATSAGNGDNMGGHYNAPYDIGIPGNVPAPWYGSAGHSACMAVGATTSGNSWASFSSYGPTQWWFSPWYEYQYPPGLIKPDIAAPGGSPGIKSCRHNSNTGYVSGWQGTSMSCPHVAGAIALMLEKDPSLTPEEIDSIIEVTALDLGSAGRDNYYGAGLLDALAAVEAVGGVSPVAGTFYCHNLGDANLIVANITYSEPWISTVAPTAFSVSPGDSEGVNVDVDTSGLAPGTYYDTLWIDSNDPDEDPYGEVVILYHGTGVEEAPVIKTYPAGYTVRCFPNPAKNAASLMFTLPRNGDITLDVYDAAGRKISTIAKGMHERGVHEIIWNRKDDNGVRVPQGIYFIRLKAKGIEAKGKLILVN